MANALVRAAVAAGVFVGFASVAPASVVFTETQFNTGSWQHTIHPFGPNGGSGGVSRVNLGPTAPALQIGNIANNNSSGAWNVVMFSAFTYNPGLSGPISNLSFSIDTRFLDRLQAVSFMIGQGGHLWRVGYSLNTSGWTTWNFSNVDVSQNEALTAGAPSMPNIVSGGPVTFGFASANSSGPGGFGYSTSGLYDNFQVTFVPAPGAAGLALAAGLLAARRRGR
jgi:hypothetical protein